MCADREEAGSNTPLGLVPRPLALRSLVDLCVRRLVVQVRTGSAGGLAGFANNGRLQQWGSPERNNNGISRQTSVTSMGSGMPMVSGDGGGRVGMVEIALLQCSVRAAAEAVPDADPPSQPFGNLPCRAPAAPATSCRRRGCPPSTATAVSCDLQSLLASLLPPLAPFST